MNFEVLVHVFTQSDDKSADLIPVQVAAQAPPYPEKECQAGPQ